MVQATASPNKFTTPLIRKIVFLICGFSLFGLVCLLAATLFFMKIRHEDKWQNSKKLLKLLRSCTEIQNSDAKHYGESFILLKGKPENIEFVNVPAMTETVFAYRRTRQVKKFWLWWTTERTDVVAEFSLGSVKIASPQTRFQFRKSTARSYKKSSTPHERETLEIYFNPPDNILCAGWLQGNLLTSGHEDEVLFIDDDEEDVVLFIADDEIESLIQQLGDKSTEFKAFGAIVFLGLFLGIQSCCVGYCYLLFIYFKPTYYPDEKTLTYYGWGSSYINVVLSFIVAWTISYIAVVICYLIIFPAYCYYVYREFK
ncbi:hypothetical protein ACFL27_22470 [candidate division CSSED10-310 bacterium]|uniref:Uncharacterized protein n=1 Tax=candidate division CSSED10-310 bacterium TaxID=2855610 RepID=A0ABV6Z3Q7_UNCC1